MKRILLTLLLLGSLSVASAQFRWGPVVGMNITDLHFRQTLFEVNQSVGYTAGVMGELMFPGIGFGIDMGINYAQRGAKLHLDQRPIWDTAGAPRSYLHYLDIPVHLRFKWTRMDGLEDYVAPLVFVGPRFDFLLAHNDIPALSYAAGDVGITVGLGFEVMKNWQITGSYTWGMTYALKTALLTDVSAQNRTWDIRVTYLF